VIVDVHTHTPTHRDRVPEGERQFNNAWRPDRAVCSTTSWQDYDDAFSSVDVSIAFNIAVDSPAEATGIPTDAARVNDATAEFVAAAPDRRIGFLSVLPYRTGALDEVERGYHDLGLRGIKVGPNYQNFDPLSREARNLYAHAERLGLPMMFHQGASPIRQAPLRYAHPLLMDEIAILHPELRVVMAHMGHPWQVETIVVIRKHPHVYADVSGLFYRPWSFYSCMRLATEWNVTDKLLLGSDIPIATPAETIEGLRRVNEIIEGTSLPHVPVPEMEALIHRDALAALGLEAPPSSSVGTR
jgi:predicted TIM-barrel fold metal-dependent hydrolase